MLLSQNRILIDFVKSDDTITGTNFLVVFIPGHYSTSSNGDHNIKSGAFTQLWITGICTELHQPTSYVNWEETEQGSVFIFYWRLFITHSTLDFYTYIRIQKKQEFCTQEKKKKHEQYSTMLNTTSPCWAVIVLAWGLCVWKNYLFFYRIF